MTNSFTRFGAVIGVALLLALGLGYFLFQQEQRLALGVWPGYSLSDVQSIDVVTPKARYTLSREQGDWFVRLAGSGPDVPPILADPTRIEALLAAIARNRPTQSVENGGRAGDLGFNAPSVRILVKPASSDLQAVQYTLGRETPTGAAVYAHSSLAPHSVYLLDASVLQQFDKPPDHYFDTRLLDVPGEEAQHLTLYGPGDNVQWELDRKDDQFVFLKPARMRGTTISASEVRLYLHNLIAFPADVILTKPMPVTGKPACVIEVQTLTAQTPQRLELYAPLAAAEVYGRSTRHPLGFLLDRDKAANLVRQAYDMQWRGVIAFDSSRIAGVRMYSVASNQTFLADRTAEGWQDRITGRKLPGIDMALWRLKELRFEAEPENNLGYPAAKRLALDLLGRDGRALSSFTFYTDPRLPADQCWLRVGAEEVYYPVTSQLLEDMQAFMPQPQFRFPQQGRNVSDPQAAGQRTGDAHGENHR